MSVPAPLHTSELGLSHVAIIMDGNGRWAKARGFPRSVGHEQGVEALRRTVEAAGDIGLTHLTVYSFSTENWRRPVSEVNALFGLLKMYVRQDLRRLVKEGVRIKILGARDGVPKDVAALIDEAEEKTAHNSGRHLNIAFNYGSREEISRAVSRIAVDVESGVLAAADVNEEAITRRLDTFGLPDPDLLIRTSGEYRLSNFLLWQLAYTEFVFLDVLWPDFDKTHLLAAIELFKTRDRRFGGITAEKATP